MITRGSISQVLLRSMAYPSLLVLVACASPEVERQVSEPDDVIGTSTHWTGTFPCADCVGIVYELDLNAETGRFILITTYISTKDGDKTYTRTGRYAWTETIVCTLAQPPEPEECFMLDDLNTLLKLDRSGNVMESEMTYELKRD